MVQRCWSGPPITAWSLRGLDRHMQPKSTRHQLKQRSHEATPLWLTPSEASPLSLDYCVADGPVRRQAWLVSESRERAVLDLERSDLTLVGWQAAQLTPWARSAQSTRPAQVTSDGGVDQQLDWPHGQLDAAPHALGACP